MKKGRAGIPARPFFMTLGTSLRRMACPVLPIRGRAGNPGTAVARALKANENHFQFQNLSVLVYVHKQPSRTAFWELVPYRSREGR